MAVFREAYESDRERLYTLWYDAVKSTHTFLSSTDLTDIALMVREQYLPYATLLVLVDRDDVPLGFMGMTDNSIDSLFIDPACFNQGLGRRFIEWAKEKHSGLLVDVNEQNSGSHAFYKRMGFRDVSRSSLDDQGRPFPIIHMAWP